MNHSKVIRKPLPLKECIVIDLLSNKSTSFKMINKLWEMLIAPDESESSELSHILSVTQCPEFNGLKDKLIANDYEVASFSSIPMKVEQFVETAMRTGLFPSPNVFSDVFALADREAYHRAGIRFLDSENNYDRLSQWDNFYAGRLITTEELRRNVDVQPRCTGKKDKRLEKLINEAYSEPDSREFKIVHQPGAGGSTIARRVAYNLFEDGKFFPIFITDLKPGATIDMLKKISESMGRVKRLLLITDDKDLNANQYTDIRNRLRQASIFPIFIRLRHEFSLRYVGNDNCSLQVHASLNSRQIICDFDDKFGTYFSQFLTNDKAQEIIRNIHDIDTSAGNSPEMINYPYAFCEKLLEKGRSYVLMNKRDYVDNWFHNIQNSQLRDLCGFVAMVYRFTASRPTDIYGLVSLWKTKENPTFQSFSKTDMEAVKHILKQSAEEGIPGESSTFWAPRYGFFAEAILNVWKIGWTNNLSYTVVAFINAYNSDLNGKEEDLFFDLFTQQSRINRGAATTGDSSIPFNDRFSLLIGFILDSQEGIVGVRRIFDKLIGKYPDNAFYRLHYGRILFEYAHKEQVGYRDKLFSDAESLVTDALRMMEKTDDSVHVAGMFWSRYAAALAREINHCDKNELNDLETSLKEAIDKANECFEECNNINSGTSPYGFFSMANLMIKSVEWYKRIYEAKNSPTSYLDSEPCLTFLDILGYCTSELTRFSYEDDVRESLDFDRIQNKYLELLGDKKKVLARAKDRFLSASDNTKVQYGHQFMYLCLSKSKHSESQRSIYRNLSPENIKFLKTMLDTMANMGDLRAAEHLFYLNRYLNNDPLKTSRTTGSLEKWYALAIEKKNNRHILKSSFYLYVCYAAQLINLDAPDATIRKKYLERREECRKLTEKLAEDPHRTWAFLGKDEIDKWACILDISEGMRYDKDSRNRIYSHSCRRVDAKVTGINGRQGDCESGELTMISFRRGDIPEYEIGKLYLKNGIIGFRYNGVGLYKFNDKYNSDSRTESERSGIGLSDSNKIILSQTSIKSNASQTTSGTRKKAESKSTEVIFKTESERKGFFRILKSATKFVKC